MAFCFSSSFISSSVRGSFIPSSRYRDTTGPIYRLVPRRERACNAVASENLGKQEEIQELMRKLDELRAKRDELTKQVGEDASTTTFSEPLTPSSSPPPAVPTNIEIGRHGEKSRFMSFSTVLGDEYYPRSVVLLPHNTTPTQVIEAPSMGGAPEQGKLVTSTIPPNFNGGRVIALQFTGKLVDLIDPICVSMPPEAVADNLPKDLDSDLVLVVERAIENEEFDKTKFYLWGIDDSVRVGWAVAKPPQAKCLGRVVCTVLEEPPERRKAKSAWEEENEVYM